MDTVSSLCSICGDPEEFCDCRPPLRTAEQNKEIHMYLTRLRIDVDNRHEMVQQITEGRVSKTSLMTPAEADVMISFLKRLTEGTQKLSSKTEATQKMRRKIFSICHEMGWEDSKGKVDTSALEKWLLKFGYKHKPLMDYTYQELPTLLTQFENLLKSSYGKESKR